MVELTTQDPITLPNGMVSVTFTATDGNYTLVDAIVVRQEQYVEMTPVDIEAEEQYRWQQWLNFINKPSEEI